MILGLTNLGAIHTLISLVAIGAGAWALIRDKAIIPDNSLGKTYVGATVLTCLTGFPIFQHGGFGPPHMLGIITLVVLAIAALAWRRKLFGGASAYVATASYSLTFFFHMIPGFTETFSRLPAGAPLFTGPDDPMLQKLIGVVFVIFLVGVTVQLIRLHKSRRTVPGAPA
ncbi:MAG: hypothetical protein JSS14_10325 [Proteobacteria bacterium]|nr:hypothetical protein [Pseudomonadota bacterium]